MQFFKSLKITLVLAAFALLASAGPRPAYAGEYNVDVTTNNPTTSVADITGGGFPNIDGRLYIRSLTLTNHNGAVPQLVSVYDSADSTTTAAKAWEGIVSASTTVHYEFPSRTFNVSDLAIKKNSTSSTLNATITYE